MDGEVDGSASSPSSMSKHATRANDVRTQVAWRSRERSVSARQAFAASKYPVA